MGFMSFFVRDIRIDMASERVYVCSRSVMKRPYREWTTDKPSDLTEEQRGLVESLRDIAGHGTKIGLVGNEIHICTSPDHPTDWEFGQIDAKVILYLETYFGR